MIYQARSPRWLSTAFALLLSIGAVPCGAAMEGAPHSTEAQLRWSVNGIEVQTLFLPMPKSGEAFQFEERLIDPSSGAVVVASFSGSPIGEVAFAIGSTNVLDVTTPFTFSITIPVTPHAGSTELAGSAAVSLTTDSAGGILSSQTGEAVWQAEIDGVPVGAPAELFADPFMLSHTGLEGSATSGSFGIPIPATGPSIGFTIGIRVQYELSPGAHFSSSSVFAAATGLPCEDSEFPTCDGDCPSGQRCEPASHDEACVCTEVFGACCIGGGTPGTPAECITSTREDCQLNGDLYLGDDVPCDDVDCIPLAVTYESHAADATPKGVLVTWTTESEVDTVGFRVLRESGHERTIEVVSPLIPAAGHALSGGSYEFLDLAKPSDAAVSYYLEDVDVFGRVNRVGPIPVVRPAQPDVKPRAAQR